jgi:phage baseplate assembly protein W
MSLTQIIANAILCCNWGCGLNLQLFYQSNRGLAQEIVAQTIQAMAAYNYGLSILIAGVDSSGGPHLKN